MRNVVFGRRRSGDDSLRSYLREAVAASPLASATLGVSNLTCSSVRWGIRDSRLRDCRPAHSGMARRNAIACRDVPMSHTSCACEVLPVANYDNDTRTVRFKHCPLHAAAPELLAALKSVWQNGYCDEPRLSKDNGHGWGDIYTCGYCGGSKPEKEGDLVHHDSCSWIKVKTAIAHATGTR